MRRQSLFSSHVLQDRASHFATCQQRDQFVSRPGQKHFTAVVHSNKESARAALAFAVLWILASPAPATVPCPRITMQPLSALARFIRDRMEPDRHYEALDLRALVPDASAERLGEVMHELWVNRQVERVGFSGWQRHRSAPPNEQRVDTQPDVPDVAPVSGCRQTKVVKPEDLFDHALFEDFFR